MFDMVVFQGPLGLQEWIAAVNDIEGGAVSPGGAAALLRVSRQFIHKLIEQKQVRSWGVYERPDFLLAVSTLDARKRITYLVVSVEDLVRYGIRVGRLGSWADIGLGCVISLPRFEEIRDDVKVVREVDKSKPVVV